MTNRARQFRALLVIACTAGSSAFASEEGRPAEPGGLVRRDTPAVVPATAGADGVPYATSEEPPGGLLHPELRDAALSGEEVAVFLLLRTGPGATGRDPIAVKQSHLPGIRAMGEQIREIELRYRPKGSLTREEERGASQVEMALTDEDRARRRHLQEEADRRLDAMRRAVAAAGVERGTAAQEAVARHVERLGGTVRARVVTGNMLDVVVPGHVLTELRDHPLVGAIVPRHEGSPSLSESPAIAGFGTWYANGYDGGPFDIGIADTGVQQNHPAFAGKVFYNNAGTTLDPNGHGTHVAGIIGSGNATYRGTAYGLDAIIWGLAGGFAFVTMDWAVTSAGQQPEVFNMSWGFGVATDTDYNYEDRWFDVYVDYYDVLISFAAGNQGWSDTTVTMQHPAVGYNAITVANMNSFGDTNRDNDVRSGSSAVGPTLAGRRKPDIAAPGSSIRSTNAFWTGTGDLGGPCSAAEPDDYCFLGGTSMAAPHVAGAALMLEDGGVFDPMAQKAILINSADWWSSRNTQTTSDDGPILTTTSTASQWDKSYGWGYLDMDHAYQHRADYFLGSVIPRNDNANEDDYKLYRGILNDGEKATLVWHRRGLRGVNWPTDKLDSSVYALSDLNLQLFSDNNGVLIDDDVVSTDTVHQVHSRVNGVTVVVKVSAWSTSFDGASSEPFALATEEGFQEVEFPDTFSGIASWPTTVQPNEVFNVTFWVINQDVAASHLNQFDLLLPAGFTLVSGVDPAPAGIAPGSGGDSTHVTWSIRAPATNGPATITAQHTHSSYGESYGPFNWNMGTTVVTDVTPPTPNPMFWGVFPFELDTSQIQMIAATATDAHGPVEYYHDYTGSPTGGTGGTDSGWITATTYTDSLLQANHQYCYRIWARDNPTTTPNQTLPSAASCNYTAITTPTGITFGALTTTSIQARSTNTPTNLTLGLSGLQVQNATTGVNSGWQQSNDLWTSAGLAANTAYTFRATARNGDGAVTPFSPGSAKYTLATTPTAGTVFPVTDDATLRATWGASGNPAGTEYLAENVTAGTNSGWISATFWDSAGLACGGAYSFRVRARNGDGVQTALVTIGSGTAGLDSEGDTIPDCLDPDDDNDGALDAADCSTLDPVVWAPPSEALNLLLTHATGVTTLAWDAPVATGTSGVVFYDTVQAVSASLWDLGGASCLEYDEGDRTSVHASDPPPGQAVFFLPRPQNRCGDGDAGAGVDAGGAPLPRSVRSCGCAHARCDVGGLLDPGCDACVAAICAADPFCCDTAWDALCVAEVGTVCGLSCP